MWTVTMKPPSSFPVSPTPALTDEVTLSATLDCVLETLPIEMQGNYTPQTVYEVLLWVASRDDSINHTCEVLEGAPSANDTRYHVSKFDDIGILETQLNGALQSRLPDDIPNHRHRLAIDLHLIPYYGAATEQNAPYLYRSAAKAGTTCFLAYATLYVIRAHHRVTLAIHALPRGEMMVATLTYLLAQLRGLRVRIQRLYLDRGFYSVPVIRWLQALRIPVLMPAIIRGQKGGPVPYATGAPATRRAIPLRVASMARWSANGRLSVAITTASAANMASAICCLGATASRLPCINCRSITALALVLKPVIA